MYSERYTVFCRGEPKPAIYRNSGRSWGQDDGHLEFGGDTIRLQISNETNFSISTWSVYSERYTVFRHGEPQLPVYKNSGRSWGQDDGHFEFGGNTIRLQISKETNFSIHWKGAQTWWPECIPTVVVLAVTLFSSHLTFDRIIHYVEFSEKDQVFASDKTATKITIIEKIHPWK